MILDEVIVASSMYCSKICLEKSEQIAKIF
jgi:hypothetical protein